MELDHLMWACSDLDSGVAQIRELTGVEAELSGSHRGLGTRNALLSLGEACYLEIIAPDPEQPLEGNFGGRLSQLSGPGLLSFAMANRNLEGLRKQLAESGFTLSDVTRTTRDTASGESLEWDLLFVQGITGAPFYIDWLECVHPALTSPAGCQIKHLSIEVENLTAFQRLTGGASELVTIKPGSEASPVLRAEIRSPKGDVVLEPVPEPTRLF